MGVNKSAERPRSWSEESLKSKLKGPRIGCVDLFSGSGEWIGVVAGVAAL